jgi:hypothetical protein
MVVAAVARLAILARHYATGCTGRHAVIFGLAIIAQDVAGAGIKNDLAARPATFGDDAHAIEKRAFKPDFTVAL